MRRRPAAPSPAGSRHGTAARAANCAPAAGGSAAPPRPTARPAAARAGASVPIPAPGSRPIGCQHVADHFRIQHHRVAGHVPVGERTHHHQQQGQNRPCQPAPAQQPEQQRLQLNTATPSDSSTRREPLPARTTSHSGPLRTSANQMLASAASASVDTRGRRRGHRRRCAGACSTANPSRRSPPAVGAIVGRATLTPARRPPQPAMPPDASAFRRELSARTRRQALPDHHLLAVRPHHRIARLATERTGEGRQVGRRTDGAELAGACGSVDQPDLQFFRGEVAAPHRAPVQEEALVAAPGRRPSGRPCLPGGLPHGVVGGGQAAGRRCSRPGSACR